MTDLQTQAADLVTEADQVTAIARAELAILGLLTAETASLLTHTKVRLLAVLTVLKAMQ
jgi:hypothetical protein